MRPAFRSKNEAVYDAIRQAIIQGEFDPGTRLVIDELANTLGVSQIPIREAMRQLEADGFVTIEPYVGARVAEINADFIFEIFALLEAMEVICSRAAARLISDDELQRMADLISQMDASENNPEQWSRENKQFHLLICDCARSSLTRKMMEKVLDHWDRLRMHYLKDVFGRRIHNAQQEHKVILAAFRERNPDAVERAIRQHNQNALAGYLAHLQSAGYISPSLEHF
jgi:DNA-binding GntR family transcriptional regulator